MPAAAVDAAGQLAEVKSVIQRDVAEVASAVLVTSTSKVSGYSREVVDAYETRDGTRDVETAMASRLA
jgi:hypothetical protein